ncbi:MAG: SWIM zinc finger family protein, partial [Thermovirgaceae bacterium]
MRNHWRYRDFYPESEPKQVQGGIKAQNRKGAFAKTWWGKRWIEVLKNFEIGKRLVRGKRYARKGQVVNLDVTKSRVKAKVQGARVKPYDILIENDTIPDKQWQQVITALSGQPRFVSSLLSGEMPQNIEEVFNRAGLSLFPGEEELRFGCSCPDSSSPCKHIAAVF